MPLPFSRWSIAKHCQISAMLLRPWYTILLWSGCLFAMLLKDTGFASELDRSLIWGTYRPQVYFGIRAAQPDSFLSGLVWFSPRSPDAFGKARHECDQADKIAGYGWKYHNGRTMAVQDIRDEQNNYIIQTSWVKTDATSADSKRAGSWAVRIEGRVIDDSKPALMSMIYYAALEDSSDQAATFEPMFEPEKYIEGLPSRGSDLEDGKFFRAKRASSSLPGFSLRFKNSPNAPNKPARPTSDAYIEHEQEFMFTRTNWHYIGARVAKDFLWRGKEVIQSDIGSSIKQAFSEYGQKGLPSPPDLLTLKDSVQPSSNFVALQRSFTGNFSFDVFYDSDDTPNAARLHGDALTLALEAEKRAYEESFSRSFPLKSETADRATFARELTSQIVGSVGYYYGQSIVDRSFTHDYDDEIAVDASEKPAADPQLTPPSELLTATPSRTAFPRGFYWDEGFHLAHIGVWDRSLSLEILRSWINLIDEDGWVAREQILGAEARSRVPAEFQTQYPTYANPPTMMMILTDYIDKLQERHSDIFPLDANEFDADISQQQLALNADGRSALYLDDPVFARSFLATVYPKLRRHYLWFRATQRGQIKEWDRKARSRTEAFRWRGRTKDHVLTSGLDDYPRAPVPHIGELHLDLHCWMGSFAETMGKVALALGEEDDAEEYERHYKAIVANLDDLHWNEVEDMFCDASVNEQDESFHVCHRGYLSLFPLLTQLLPANSKRLESILDMMHDPLHLWTPYGLRSLSKQNRFYGQGEDYWRGPVWVPMNYLALRALKKKYAAEPGPYQAKAALLYDELRKNVVDNVYREYRRTGFTYEQYNAQTGLGQRSFPFTGWTSMAAMIMAEEY